MSGWIKLHRSIADNDLWTSEKFTRGQAWVDLLMLTMHDKGHIRVNGIRIDLVRGECGYSELKLSKRWIWSRPKVKKFLKELEKDSMISRKSYNGFNIISVCNYSLYQSGVTTDSTTDDTTEVQRKSTRNTTDGTLLKNDKNEENVKNDKKVLLLFDEFWKLYPKQRKGNKAKSLTAYQKALSENRATEQEILEGVKNYVGSREVQDGYAKGAAAWLNDDRWTDQPSLGTGTGSQGGQRYAGNKEPASRAAAHREAIDRMGLQHGLRQGGGEGDEMPDTSTD